MEDERERVLYLRYIKYIVRSIKLYCKMYKDTARKEEFVNNFIVEITENTHLDNRRRSTLMSAMLRVSAEYANERLGEGRIDQDLVTREFRRMERALSMNPLEYVKYFLWQNLAKQRIS